MLLTCLKCINSYGDTPTLRPTICTTWSLGEYKIVTIIRLSKYSIPMCPENLYHQTWELLKTFQTNSHRYCSLSEKKVTKVITGAVHFQKVPHLPLNAGADLPIR